MPKPSADPSPLVSAAEAVERELRIYERAAEELLSLTVDSQKRLHRAGRLLGEVCDVEDRLRERLVALVQVIGEARDQQESRVLKVEARAEELAERTEQYRELMLRLEALGQSVGAIPTDAAEADLATVQHHVAAALEHAAALEADAEAASFRDVAREVRGRRDQLAALLAKIGRAVDLPEA